MDRVNKNSAIFGLKETDKGQKQNWAQEKQNADTTETDDLPMSSERHEPTDDKDCPESEDDGVPYDRGWAWVVACACFFNYLILSGCLKCLGIFYVELLHWFHCSASQTGLVFSIKAGVLSLSGPIVMTVVVNRLGIKWTAMTGAVLLSLSMILSSLANKLMVIICLMGILFGLGQAIVPSTGEVLMGSYFRKSQYLAIILAKCGASFGNILFPLLITYFLQEYGLHGTLLLTGGLCLHCIPTTMLFRPTSFFVKQKKRTSNQKREGTKDFEQRKTLILNDQKRGDVNTKMMLQRPNFMAEMKRYSLSSETSNIIFEVVSINSTISLQLNKIFLDGNNLKRSENYGTSYKEDSRSTYGFLKKSDLFTTVADKQKSIEIPSTTTKTVFSSESAFCQKSDSYVQTHCDREQIFSRDDTGNSDFRSQSKQHIVVSGSTAGEDNAHVSVRSKKCPKCLSSLDCSIFTRPLFRLLLAYFVLFSSLNVMADYLPALAHENNITASQVALLLGIIGGLDFVSRVSCAVIANAKIVRVSTIAATAFFVLGVTSQFVRYMTSFNHFLLLSVLLGLLGGVGNVMVPVLVLDFVGLEKMAEALGFVLLVAGPSTTAIYPLLGFIRDSTGSYVVVYHVIGGAAILAAGLLCCEKWVRGLEHEKGNVEIK